MVFGFIGLFVAGILAATFLYGMAYGTAKIVQENVAARERAESQLHDLGEELSRERFNRAQERQAADQAFERLRRRIEEEGVGKSILLPQGYYDSLRDL